MTTAAAPTAQRRSGRTLRDALRSAEDRLDASGVPSPRVDAEELAAHLLNVPRGELWSHLDAGVPTGFDDLVARRAERIPLQHLTGRAHFRTISLSVGPGVFSPRPETEVVVEYALGVLRDVSSERPVVVDLCAGSGTMAAAIAVEAPQSEVHAVEADPGAVRWLGINSEVHGFTAHASDIDGCLSQLDGVVDVVVANPPYIPEGCVPRDPEVAEHDPAMALYSGVDGLDHMRVVARTAARLLRPGGWVVAEHGDLQGESVPALFAAGADWTDVHDHVDLTGRDRFVVARRMDA